MKVAVSGCCHGALDILYQTIEEYERQTNGKVDLLLCCGDFQSFRDNADLQCMACPPKYRTLGDFQKYYNHIKVAPVLTIFIGGNHEASNVLRELYFGGWVAERIFYLGQSGVVRVGPSLERSIRIAGVSGIYNKHDYERGYFELPPYDERTIRTSIHMRRFEIHKLLQLEGRVDVILTHDWPRGVAQYGNVERLLQQKPFFADEVRDNTLGNPVTTELLQRLQPRFWFSGHLHVHYAASVIHPNHEVTRFLATDKPIPGRHFLHFVDIPLSTAGEAPLLVPRLDDPSPIRIFADLDWFAIVKESLKNIPVHDGYVEGCTRPPSAESRLALNTRFKHIQSLCFRTVNENHHHPSDDPSVEWTAAAWNDNKVQRLQFLEALDEPDTFFMMLIALKNRTTTTKLDLSSPAQKLAVHWRRDAIAPRQFYSGRGELRSERDLLIEGQAEGGIRKTSEHEVVVGQESEFNSRSAEAAAEQTLKTNDEELDIEL